MFEFDRHKTFVAIPLNGNVAKSFLGFVVPPLGGFNSTVLPPKGGTTSNRPGFPAFQRCLKRKTRGSDACVFSIFQ